jgi:hypothetical protein
MVVVDRIAHRDRQPKEAAAMTTTHRISTGAVLALALATGAAPVSARPFDLNPNGSYVPVVAAAHGQATRASGSLSAPPTIVRVTARNTGFDWGDAGIGAAGGLALSMIGLGGTLAVSQHRNRRNRHTTALTN